MTKRRRQVLIWGSVIVGLASVIAALLLGATLADVLLGVGTTIGLAALVFWLEQHWEQRADEIEQRADEKIEEASRAINERIDGVLASTTQSAATFVADQSTPTARCSTSTSPTPPRTGTWTCSTASLTSD